MRDFISEHKMLKRFIFSLCLILIVFEVSAQNLTDTLTVYFRKESAILDKAYMENGKRIEAFVNWFKAVKSISCDSTITIKTIGASSPEGQFLFNKLIAGKRQERIARLLHKELGVNADMIQSTVINEDWDGMINHIIADPKVTHKERILNTIELYGANEKSDDQTVNELLKIGYARPYWYIYHNIFPHLRAATVIVSADISHLFEEVVIEDEEISLEDDVIDSATDTLPAIMDYVPTRTGDVVIKANAIGYAMAAANVAVEAYFAENWSVNIPFYYSGLNYFKSTLKLRLCTIQPEIRYHFKAVDGLFAGAHLGLGWFNMALDGKYRVQDAGGKRPAIGGGLGLGYKMQFKKAPKWGMEFSLGAGVYDVRYDLLYNEYNGPYAKKNIHNTFIGIDNAAVSFTYTFDYEKGGRR